MSRKTVFFDDYCGYLMAAVTENGKITEFNFEKRGKGTVIGNIYKGRVENVLPGMQAAFINCGLERNCYVSSDDLFPDAGKYGAEDAAVSLPPLKEGDEIIVQVVKAPVGKKGARVTTHPSFVGKCLIYMPETPFVGCSRRITDEELRRNLIYNANEKRRGNEGIIMRTAAPYARRNQVEIELDYLRNMYAEILKAAKTAKTGDLLYSDVALPIRVLRDTLSYDIERIVVGSKRLEQLISNMVKLYPSSYHRPVVLHDTGRDLMEETGLAEQISEIASPRVELDNGAYLVIEKTEALTVIDVNTGKFTGDDSLEQTVYYTNILAAREIARQVKLRNIGGIVVVDFIDMTNPAHNKALVEELERALKRDKSRCSVSPMSKFGLVEFTRKREGSSPLSLMLKPCKYCGDSGQTKTFEFIVLGVRAQILKMYCDGARFIRLEMNRDLLTRICGWDELLRDLSERCPEAVLYAVPHRTFHEEYVIYRTDKDELPADAVRLL